MGKAHSGELMQIRMRSDREIRETVAPNISAGANALLDARIPDEIANVTGAANMNEAVYKSKGVERAA